MQVQTFLAARGQEEQCRNYVEEFLRNSGVPDALVQLLTTVAMLVARIEDPDERWEPWKPDLHVALKSQVFGWAIRDTDLELVKNIATPFATTLAGAAATAATNGSAVVPLVTAFVGLIIGAYNLHFNVTKKGAELDPIKLSVLYALKELNVGRGARPAEIAAFLEAAAISEAEVLEELQSLEKVTTSNGTANVRFAFPDANGRWRTDC